MIDDMRYEICQASLVLQGYNAAIPKSDKTHRSGYEFLWVQRVSRHGYGCRFFGAYRMKKELQEYDG